MKKFIQTFLAALILCFSCICLGLTILVSKTSTIDAKAETEVANIDMGTLLDNDYIVFSGDKVYEIGKSTDYTVKTRIYLQDGYEVTFYLNSDGNPCNGHPYGGATSFRLKDDTEVMWGWPGAWHITQAGTWYGKTLEAGKVYDLEFGITKVSDAVYQLFVSINGDVWDVEAGMNDAVFHGGLGTKLGISGRGIVLEKATATCDHEIATEWTTPNEKGEMYLKCVHCDIALQTSYFADLVDFSDLAKLNTTLLSGKGVLGELPKAAGIGLKAKLYLPEDGKFSLNFALMGNGKKLSSIGELYGSFTYVFMQGKIRVLYPNGEIIKTADVPALKAGDSVIIEFGVYAMSDNQRMFFVRVNGEEVLSGSGENQNEPLGTMVTYSFSRAALIETITATCEHEEGEPAVADEDGYINIPCVNCGNILYQQHVQTVYDISHFIGDEPVTWGNSDGLLKMDVKQEEYVAIKGLMHIPEDTSKNFLMDFILFTDATTKVFSGTGVNDGLYLWRFQNGVAYPCMPWAVHFFVPTQVGVSAMKPGKTFEFEIGVYQVTDSDVRYTYLKINGKTLLEFTYYENNFACGTLFTFQTNEDVVLMSANSECTKSVHSISNWSEMNSDYMIQKVCDNCGKVMLEKEIPSTVEFQSNLIGLIELAPVEAVGKTFTYNVPATRGYKIADIKANGVSVFDSAEELAYGYQVTIPRDSLSIILDVEYVSQNYTVSYQYNTNAAIKVTNNQVGHGDIATYLITMKNGNVITNATVNGKDVTEDLVIVKGGYELKVMNVSSNISLVLATQKKNFKIVLEDNIGGTLKTNKTTVDAFGYAEISVALQENYMISYYLVNGVKTASKNGVLTVDNITEDLTISAVYVSLIQEVNGDDSSNQVSNSNGNYGCNSYVGIAGCLLPLLAVGVICFKKKQEL